MNFNPQILTQFLDGLFLCWPELAEDAELRQRVVYQGTDFLKAVTACLNEMNEADSMIEGIAWRRKNLDARMGRLERKSDAMRDLIQKLMEYAQEKKVVLPEATLSLSQKPAFVMILDETQIPSNLFRIKKEPDKARIKEFLLHGQEIPGATLSNGGVGLTIRCK
jgi:hypothetical protein